MQHLPVRMRGWRTARGVRCPPAMGRCRLKDDHEAIRALLARIERGEAEVCELGPVLEPHLAFEEEEVLSRLSERLPTGTGPIRTILEDHQTIRDLLAGLAVALDDREAFEHLAGLLLAHFQKEEELVMPFAHAHFCAEELGQIGCAPTAPSQGVTS